MPMSANKSNNNAVYGKAKQKGSNFGVSMTNTTAEDVQENNGEEFAGFSGRLNLRRS